MTWFASAANQTAADAPHVEVVTFVDLDLPSGHLRLHTHGGFLTVNNDSYLGVGKLGAISEVQEDTEMRPAGVTLKLSGVDSALITAARDEKYHGRAVLIYKGFLNPATMVLAAEPELVFRGLMDKMTFDVGAGYGSIVVDCENEWARWQRHNNSLYTTESQQALYPGDLGFSDMTAMQFRVIDWSKNNLWQPSQRNLFARDLLNRLR